MKFIIIIIICKKKLWDFFLSFFFSLLFFLLFFYTLYYPFHFRKFGPPYSGKATAAARAVLPSPTSACWVFRVSVIHQTLTWTTGSLTCVDGLLYACVYTWGLVTLTASQHNLFDSEKLKFFLCSWQDLNPRHRKKMMQTQYSLSTTAQTKQTKNWTCLELFHVYNYVKFTDHTMAWYWLDLLIYVCICFLLLLMGVFNINFTWHGFHFRDISRAKIRSYRLRFLSAIPKDCLIFNKNWFCCMFVHLCHIHVHRNVGSICTCNVTGWRGGSIGRA